MKNIRVKFLGYKHIDVRDYLTVGRIYNAKAMDKDCFMVIDDEGTEICCLFEDCSYGVWAVMSEEDERNQICIPEGYVLVPKEPTPEMLEAAKDWTGLTRTAEVVYKSMIAASPLIGKGGGEENEVK